MSNPRATLQSLATQLKANTDTLDEIHQILLGKPPEQVGLVMKVDRLEQVEQRRLWHIRALWASIVASGLGLLLPK